MRRLNLLVLRSSDIGAARRFYEFFGFVFERHAHRSGPEHYASEDEADGGVFELYPVAPGGAADQAGLGFAATDLDAIRSRLAEAGYSPQPIKDNPWGRTFVIRDPDGRRVEVTAAAANEA